ncbi:ATP-binding protein [Mesonia sp. MT50]|uniref:ATP-binding protein n=1 Tax=Mesonia profundi TaxID=3070998 RepID=A0ABU1A0L1_9FLAO|nr:ATP-binding protein [Mesonia profundi]MDQ7917144.1 ATP-binding protein [Mesonia profundi]
MINKRLLIKNLLAHSDENSFYDKKLQVNLGDKEGKAKLLKHICALSNSNPYNNSYIVIGVEDQKNLIIGVDFYDDSKIQNLVNAYLTHPPRVNYANILFPHLPDGKVVGLISISPNKERVCSLKKNIWKYYGGMVFYRKGSISMPQNFEVKVDHSNVEKVAAIESHSQNTIKYTLDGVFDFMQRSKDYDPTYHVFKEYFVVCWAGKKKVNERGTFYSRVNIQLINEQVKLFYSDLDEVSIEIGDDYFKILEYVHLGLYKSYRYYPLEEVTIKFHNNISYEIENKMLFEPPLFSKSTLYHIMNSNSSLIHKMQKQIRLSEIEKEDLLKLPANYLLCYFNGFPEAIEELEKSKELLKENYPEAYVRYKENIRILRKVKYN